MTSHTGSWLHVSISSFAGFARYKNSETVYCTYLNLNWIIFCTRQSSIVYSMMNERLRNNASYLRFSTFQWKNRTVRRKYKCVFVREQAASLCIVRHLQEILITLMNTQIALANWQRLSDDLHLQRNYIQEEYIITHEYLSPRSYVIWIYITTPVYFRLI